MHQIQSEMDRNRLQEIFKRCCKKERIGVINRLLLFVLNMKYLIEVGN